MSTNYYVIKEELCPHCAGVLDEKEVHLGKQSSRAKFLFRASGEYWSFGDFIFYIKDKVIVDEYGATVEPIDLIEKIQRNQWGKSHRNWLDTSKFRIEEGYEFYDGDFC